MILPTVNRAVPLGVKHHLVPMTRFCYSQAVAGLLMWDVFCHKRTGLSFTTAADLASQVILGSESSGTNDHVLLSEVRDSPQAGGQSPPPPLISPTNRVALL
jgi:hypothetical protein